MRKIGRKTGCGRNLRRMWWKTRWFSWGKNVWGTKLRTKIRGEKIDEEWFENDKNVKNNKKLWGFFWWKRENENNNENGYTLEHT